MPASNESGRLAAVLHGGIAPQIAGRMPGMPRRALVEGLGSQPGAAPWAALGSVMRAGTNLLLRYRLTETSRHAGEPA